MAPGSGVSAGGLARAGAFLPEIRTCSAAVARRSSAPVACIRARELKSMPVGARATLAGQESPGSLSASDSLRRASSASKTIDARRNKSSLAMNQKNCAEVQGEAAAQTSPKAIASSWHPLKWVVASSIQRAKGRAAVSPRKAEKTSSSRWTSCTTRSEDAVVAGCEWWSIKLQTGSVGSRLGRVANWAKRCRSGAISSSWLVLETDRQN
eukprot:11914131-Heterocapsa_arctica.AAC.2